MPIRPKLESREASLERTRAIAREYSTKYLDAEEGPSVVHSGNIALLYLVSHAIHEGLTSRDMFIHFLDVLLNPKSKL